MLCVRDLAVHASLAVALLACGDTRRMLDADAIGPDVPDGSVADALDDLPGSRDAVTDAAVETVPRAIAPMPGSTVTSQQPTFHVGLPPGGAPTVVEVCSTRSCTSIEQSLPVGGSSVRASAPLTPGVHFWRLRDGARTSPPWWFWVGVRSAATDTSWGSRPDFDGDGLPEVLVGASHGGADGVGRAYVFAGTRGSFATTPITTLTGTEHVGYFGWWVASAGDLNGDGFVDAVVGAPDVEVYAGRVYVFMGSELGLHALPDITLLPPESMGNFGSVVSSAGDVNGDGYADVLVGAPNTDLATGSLFVYLGSRDGIRSAPASVIHGPSGHGGSFASGFGPAGDVNADGFADVIVGANGANSGSGESYLFLGGPGGLAAMPAVVFASPVAGAAELGTFANGAGDMNGDGYADVIIGASGTETGNAYVYFGGTSLSAMPRLTLTGPDGLQGGFGWSAGGAGDVNHDGFDDVVLSADCAPWMDVSDGGYSQCGSGRAYVFQGSASALSTVPAQTLSAPTEPGARFGWSIVGAGDINGDGMTDVVASAFGLNTFDGAVYVFAGSAGGLLPVPAAALSGAAGTAENFGWSVALRRVCRALPSG